jgi:segregation and condensation protein A
MPISVKTPVFEGPLDLLLDLIEKHKLLINDISLANVADEFITYVQNSPELPVGETAEFVSLAATLLLIKSRSLLPSLTLTDDEHNDIKELEYRLAVYQLIKEAGKDLPFKANYLYDGYAPEPEAMYLPDQTVTQPSLRSAAQALIDGFPALLSLPKVTVKKIISLEDMIGTMATRIGAAFRMSFKDFSKTHNHKEVAEARHHVIVSFLALLELVKQGIIKATQEGDDIHMESDAVSTPRYE